MRLAMDETLSACSACSRGTASPFTLTVNSRCSAAMGRVRSAGMVWFGRLFLQRRETHAGAGRQVAQAIEAVGTGHFQVQAGIAIDLLAQPGQALAGPQHAHMGQVGRGVLGQGNAGLVLQRVDEGGTDGGAQRRTIGLEQLVPCTLR
eukprot:Opistho-2@82692